jgi:hypothetical protein
MGKDKRKFVVQNSTKEIYMSRVRFVYLVFALMTPLVGGVLTSSNAATTDRTEVVFRGQTFTEVDVRGAYAFSFEGTVIQSGSIAAVGVLLADGTGNIIDAVRTLNVNGTAVRQTFTCTYSVNPNGTGSASCPLDNPVPGAPTAETFDFALENAGRAFRLIGTTPGITVIGSGTRQ